MSQLEVIVQKYFPSLRGSSEGSLKSVFGSSIVESPRKKDFQAPIVLLSVRLFRNTWREAEVSNVKAECPAVQSIPGSRPQERLARRMTAIV
jgi:hypothetical protein